MTSRGWSPTRRKKGAGVNLWGNIYAEGKRDILNAVKSVPLTRHEENIAYPGNSTRKASSWAPLSAPTIRKFSNRKPDNTPKPGQTRQGNLSAQEGVMSCHSETLM